MADLAAAGQGLPIPGLNGVWMRQPDTVRYGYLEASTTCPICLRAGSGVPWRGWFWCERADCCVALVSTGEVFVRIGDEVD